MKTTKGGKVMNPTDAYRKELRKNELKRNKKERKKVREVGLLKKDPDAIREQIQKLEMMKADGALDKARKHKKRQLKDTLNLALKKRKMEKLCCLRTKKRPKFSLWTTIKVCNDLPDLWWISCIENFKFVL